MMSDPWSIDYFNPPAPQAPAAPVKSPKLIPEADRLYQVQKNALKALNRVQEIERSLQGKGDPNDREKNMQHRRLERELQQLERDIENTYRVIRSWLVEHT